MPRNTTKSATNPVRSGVDFVRPEVKDMLPVWERIRAACSGERAVKALGDKVLPRPNAADLSTENRARFDAYLFRAVWYNASGRTSEALTGHVFSKEPVVTLPPTMKAMENNVDGSGVTLPQQAKAALRNVLQLGRGGLLVDYPKTDGAVSRQALLDGHIGPTIVLYEPEQITNWQTSAQGSKVFLDLIVLRETISTPGNNEFESGVAVQYRVLKRTPETGVTGHIYQKQGEGESADYKEVLELAYQPTNHSGRPLQEIPFVFIGAQSNDHTIDTPPLQDLTDLNFAHFRNSADHEEACFLVGQPTPWVSGLTQEWVDNVLKGTIMIGSRACIPLPNGGQAGLLQALPNTMPFEAMKHKETQMVALGAKLVQDKEVQRTATEASMDQAAETSVLVSCATNVFKGYEMALKYAAQLTGGEETGIAFELSEPLSRNPITPEVAQAIMALWQGTLVDFEEARDLLKKSGWAWKEDDKVKAANEAEGFDLGQPQPEPGAKPVPGMPTPPAPKPAA